MRTSFEDAQPSRAQVALGAKAGLVRAEPRKQRRPRVAVVVPAYNEARLIERTLRSIPARASLVIVVDDGSADGTAQRAQSVGDRRVEVVQHLVNRGVGAAITTGYRRAFAGGADVCVVMAGDAQMDARDFDALIAPVLDGSAEYVKGDRLSFPEVERHMPRARLLGNITLSAFTRLATGLPISDSQCGYTALSRRAAERLPLERLWPRYGYPNDLLGMLAEREFAVRDVIVRPVYGDEKSGIGLRHAVFVIPFVLLRVVLRRIARMLNAERSALEPTER